MTSPAVSAPVPAPAPGGSPVYDAFISYSPQDERWVEATLVPTLQREGYRILADPRDLDGALGQPLLTVWELAVDCSRYTLAVLTQAWVEGVWEQFAQLLASTDAVERRRRRLLPLLLEKCQPPRHIAGLTYADFTRDDRRDEEMKRLVRNLRLDPDPPRPATVVLNEHTTRVARDGLDALRNLIENDKVVKEAVRGYCDTFTATRAQLDLLGRYKDLHAQLHRLQVYCYNLILQEIKRFPKESLDWGALADYRTTLEDIINHLREVLAEATFTRTEANWVRTLVQALADGCVELDRAIQGADALELKKAAWSINRVLSRHPSYISTSLTRMARDLKLRDLEQALGTVRAQLNDPSLNLDQVRQFADGVVALGQLSYDLGVLIDDHDRWQQFDSELRRIEDNLDQDVRQELKWSWPTLSVGGDELCGASREPWAEGLRRDAERLHAALAADQVDGIRQVFRAYRGRALQRFFRVDEELLRQCDKLKMIGTSLSSILGMMR